MSITRKNVYEYKCDGPGCKTSAETSSREPPKGWAELLMGDVRRHFCVKCGAGLMGGGK